jgi:hypothetical protein
LLEIYRRRHASIRVNLLGVMRNEIEVVTKWIDASMHIVALTGARIDRVAFQIFAARKACRVSQRRKRTSPSAAPARHWTGSSLVSGGR